MEIEQKMSQSKSREATSHPSEALPSQEKWWDLFQERLAPFQSQDGERPQRLDEVMVTETANPDPGAARCSGRRSAGGEAAVQHLIRRSHRRVLTNMTSQSQNLLKRWCRWSRRGTVPHNPPETHLQIPSQYYPNTDPDEIAEVEKINLYVKCAGKTMEVEVFPMENISVLLKEACDRSGKKPEKMTLVYKGKYLDGNENVCHYGLRRGTTLNLIYHNE
ncbi:hypothetical protein F2P79_007024 [Pimephales promelas]|nr:hypothetical protein F2P79_007024 [Pimephales promelas]